MKVIFLDIDGVLTSLNSIHANNALYKASADRLVEDHIIMYKRAGKEDMINTTQFYDEAYKQCKHIIRDVYGHKFDASCLSILECIMIKYPDVKFVISSSWRYSGISVMKEMFDSRSDIINNTDILDCTWYANHIFTKNMSTYVDKVKEEWDGVYCRGTEIEGWLRWYNDNYEDKIDDYLIIDDESCILQSQMSHFIHTDTDTGLVLDNLKQIYEYCSKHNW